MELAWSNAAIAYFATAVPYLIAETVSQPTLRTPIAISFGAIAGALSRYYLGLWCAQRFGTGFPYGTLLANLSGSLLMGFIVTAIAERVFFLAPEAQLLITAGFLGSYTTFSSYELDVFRLAERKVFLASAYWIGSAALGLVSLYLGVLAARSLLRS